MFIISTYFDPIFLVRFVFWLERWTLNKQNFLKIFDVFHVSCVSVKHIQGDSWGMCNTL
jgi:hypothetical protein